MSAHDTPLPSDEAASPPPRPPKRSGSSSEDTYSHTSYAEGTQWTATTNSRPALLQQMHALHSDDAVSLERASSRKPRDRGEEHHCFLNGKTDVVCNSGAAEAATHTIFHHNVALDNVVLPIATTTARSPGAPGAAAVEQLTAMMAVRSPGGREGCAVDEDDGDRDQRTHYEATNAAEGVAHETTPNGSDRATRCGTYLVNTAQVGTATAAEAEDEESEDEDEDGFFQETVLFMNNDFQSLGSTRRTPSKTSQQLSQERVLGPVSTTPLKLHSMELVTPAKRTPSVSEIPGGDGSTGRPGQVGPCALSSETKERSAADTTTSPSLSIRLSPTTKMNVHAPMVPPSSFHTPQQCDRLDAHASVSAAATATTTAAAASPAATEYFFIDNLDGTAYLADASLQLDGTYALGQTLLLAQSSSYSGASAKTTLHRGAAGTESPVVTPQFSSDLPQQRANAVHRPLRGARLTMASQARLGASVSSSSPSPHLTQNCAGSPTSPSIARAVVRRSAAQSCDASRLLSSTFSDSFAFDQTLLVPLDASYNGGRTAVIADASLISSRSYRRAVPVRWDANASPTVLAPMFSPPVVSKALRAGDGCREHGVPRHSPPPSCPLSAASCSASPASPVPHSPIVAEHVAYQQARATRERRITRPDQDVIYLIPDDATTAMMTSEEITSQGWIPVQMVDALPSAAVTALTAADGDGRFRSYIVGGGAESPLPKNPPAPTSAARVDSQGNRVEEFEREQSLSRQPCSGNGGVASPILSPASTLSASTLECINRRLNYSISGWASTHQRFGAASQSGADGASVPNFAGCIVLPPATPLSVVEHVHKPHHNTSGSIQREESLTHFGTEKAFSGSHSPVPVAPECSEALVRAPSPSRCTDVATSMAPRQQGRPINAPVAEKDNTGDSVNVDCGSLLTSMSYQRPSTVGTMASELYANDGSLSLPLTSSASASLRVGALQLGVGAGALGAVALQHHPQQAPQQLRAPHPRRVTAIRFSHDTASSSVSMPAFGERIPCMPTGAAPPSSSTTDGDGGSFRTTYCNHQTSVTSMETVSPDPILGSGGGDCPSSNSVSAAGLPLSRGTLGMVTAAGPRGERTHLYAGNQHRYRQQRAGMARIRSAGSFQAQKDVADVAAMSVSGTVLRSGAVSRNSALHHQRHTSPQQDFIRRFEATPRVGGAMSGRVDSRRAALAAVRLVPDTSVFLPWAPLTITPEGSLNLGGSEGTDTGIGTTASTGASMHCSPITLRPFTSSADAGAMTTTTTNTTASDTVSTPQAAQRITNDLPGSDSTHSPVTLANFEYHRCGGSAPRTAAAYHPAPTSAAGSRDTFASSFLQHAVSQVPTSVVRSLNSASVATTMGQARSTSVSRVSTATALHETVSTVCDSNVAVTAVMEATMNEFEASLRPASAETETEPDAHAPSTASATPSVPPSPQVSRHDYDAHKENRATCFPGTFSSIGAGLPTDGALRSLVCREGSAANAAVPLPSKARSPSHSAPLQDTSLLGQPRSQ
ncbi:hypothetical protein JKF63_05436 [Porcisia hertigi]|uniref:Uncharacterized protein n=1 Tax=Porcisia hertigi TaxID=2761500 RepID=A0A836IVX6_9TRYP|nr:hypothetical protein JKF63_05436 [Porcisia hertigi]